MRIGAIGTAASAVPASDSCGANPCTWFDNVYVGDSCLSFLQCADPTNLLVTGANQGLLAATGQAVTQVAVGAVSGAATGLVNDTGVAPSTFVWIAGLAAVGFLVFSLKK